MVRAPARRSRYLLVGRALGAYSAVSH